MGRIAAAGLRKTAAVLCCFIYRVSFYLSPFDFRSRSLITLMIGFIKFLQRLSNVAVMSLVSAVLHMSSIYVRMEDASRGGWWWCF